MRHKITSNQMFIKFVLQIYEFHLHPRTDESNGADADAQPSPPGDGHDRMEAEIIAANEQVHVC